VIDDTEDGSKGSALMHSKFILIDCRDVVTGSANFTLSDVHGDMSDGDTRGNANSLIGFWDEPKVAQIFAEEFAVMWGDGPGGKKDSLFGVNKPHRGARRVALANGDFANIQFSPTSRRLGYEHSSAGLIERTLKMASKSVHAALFVFSDQRLSNQINERYTIHPQMDVSALVENRFAFQWYSELLDMLGVEMLSDKCRRQEGNSPWARPIYAGGIAGLASGDMLHHKFAVVDQYYTIFGSHNWTSSANDSNDETLVVLESFQTGQEFSQEFSRLQGNGRFGLPKWAQDRIEERRRECSGRYLPGFDFGDFDRLF